LRRPFQAAFAAACFAVGTTGCFDQGAEFQQLAPPSLPPGATRAPDAPIPEIFPLSPGARLEYAARFGLGGGQFEGQAILSVLDAWVVGPRLVTSVGITSSYFGRTRQDRYGFVREGQWLGLFEKAPPDKLTLFMPTHLKVGDAWEVATGEGTGRATVEAQEDVAVPAGHYRACYRVHYVNDAVATNVLLWLAPYVGLVKATVAIRIGPLPLSGSLTLTHSFKAL
jgi:hypothetical protein